MIMLLKRVSQVRILPGAPCSTPLTWGFSPREAPCSALGASSGAVCVSRRGVDLPNITRWTSILSPPRMTSRTACTPLQLYAQTLPDIRDLRRRRGRLSIATSGGGHTGRYRLLPAADHPHRSVGPPGHSDYWEGKVKRNQSLRYRASMWLVACSLCCTRSEEASRSALPHGSAPARQAVARAPQSF